MGFGAQQVATDKPQSSSLAERQQSLATFLLAVNPALFSRSTRSGTPQIVGSAAHLASVAPARASHVKASDAETPVLHVGIVGYGLVGKELVNQILSSSKSLREELGVGVEVAAVARSTTMALLASGSDGALSGGAWPSTEEPADFEKLAEHLLALAKASGGRAIIVDNTASDAPADAYEKWLAAGIDVATPNKRAGSGPLDRYNRIMAAAKQGGSRFMYEATVGAGLPVVGPLQTLRRAGDEVEKVEGIFSGTLSYIFNTWKPGMLYSSVVEDARQKGFTEPDPRDDLGGTDVQRKVTILARELGLKFELDDVPVESLVPESLRSWEPPAGEQLGEAFVKELVKYDEEMKALIEKAEAANEILRFVGSIDIKAGTASVKLGRFPKDHPFASTQFADNIVTYNTKWYSPRPLVIQGPGAGAEVTAAGVFGNVMESMSALKKKM
jgi:aspartokinase/homoserine dehydrogenase 1